MSRRFLGFTVQLAEDKWLCMDHNSCSAVVGPKEHRGHWPTRTDAEADILDAGESIEAARVSPVFAVPKGTFASFVAHCNRVGKLDEPKPAPVVAAEGRYAVLRGYEGAFWFNDVRAPDDTKISGAGSRDEATAAIARAKKGALVRILPDGAFEAALEAARREERERAFAEVEAYAARVSKQYGEADPHSWSGGCSIAFAEIAEFARNEAGKGQAK